MIRPHLELLLLLGSQSIDEFLDPVAEKFPNYDLTMVKVRHLEVPFEVSALVECCQNFSCPIFMGVPCGAFRDTS